MKFIKVILDKEPIISALGAFLCISLIAFINSFDDFNIWLIPPFGDCLVKRLSDKGVTFESPVEI